MAIITQITALYHCGELKSILQLSISNLKCGTAGCRGPAKILALPWIVFAECSLHIIVQYLFSPTPFCLKYKTPHTWLINPLPRFVSVDRKDAFTSKSNLEKSNITYYSTFDWVKVYLDQMPKSTIIILLRKIKCYTVITCNSSYINMSQTHVTHFNHNSEYHHRNICTGFIIKHYVYVTTCIYMQTFSL